MIHSRKLLRSAARAALWWGVIVCLFPHAVGGETVPAPVKPDAEGGVLTTEYDDQAAGRQAAEEIRAELGLVEDAELTRFVNQVGTRVARHAPGFRFDYHFQIVDQDTPNAFSLPGGYIYVSRGLLVLSNSEAELANILGHEIAHVARRHAAARQRLMPRSPLLFNWLRVRKLAAYSREQEREADRLGQTLAAQAGYDPNGMATVMKSLEFAARLQLGYSRIPMFLDTHPGTIERSAAAADRAGKLPWTVVPGVSSDRAHYLERLDGLAVGTSASEGVFDKHRFLHPDLGFIMRFPEHWETRNTRRAVGALSPDRAGQVFLEYQGPGSDPIAAAHEYLASVQRDGLRPSRSQPLRIAGNAAYRVLGVAATPQGGTRFVLTWIAHRGSIYRLTGLANPGSWSRYEGVFLSVARSFRGLTPELRQSIHEIRLRIVTARPGESLQRLSQRTGNQWDLQRTALMNDMFADQHPGAGQRVKVAVREVYRPQKD